MENQIEKQSAVMGRNVFVHPYGSVVSSGVRGKAARLNLKPLAAAMLAASMLAACGGGGGGGDGAATTQPDTGTQNGGTTPPGGTQPGGTQPGGTQPGGTQPGGTQPGGTDPGTTPPGGTQPGGTTQPGTATPPAAVPTTASMTMNCVDGTSFQCSGSGIIRTDNGVALTSSGVQVYGKSTNDLATPIVVKTSASGLMLDSGGAAEVRVGKDAAGNVTTPALILSNLGLSWDGKVERPLIVETFRPVMSRAQLGSNGALTFGTLPDPSDLSFYNFATLGVNGTQANYANNSYFPRTGNPPRCPVDVIPCPTSESDGVQNSLGDWRTGGGAPDIASASRLHEDGDIHAGNDTPGPGGAVRILPGGNGVGVPFPGSKGYRHFSNWSYRYANLASWTSQDTVLIEEWANQGNEHNKNRRGFVSFGNVTDPGAVPSSGTATYTGIAYGWYGRGALEEPPLFRSNATITVNFATRQVTVAIADSATFDAAATAVPANFTANTALGAAGSNVAAYLTGALTSGTLTGGVSGRLFGPVVSTGTSGAGPAEIGGAFRMAGGAGVAVVGGFIGRKQ